MEKKYTFFTIESKFKIFIFLNKEKYYLLTGWGEPLAVMFVTLHINKGKEKRERES